MPDYPVLQRADVVEMLEQLGGSSTDSVLERLSSMQVAWLVHQVEQRYQVQLDLDDDQLAQLRTISDAVQVLGESVQAERA